MRTQDVHCDYCGAAKPPRPRLAPTWWVLEDLGEVQRTGALDFCSLPCVAAFIADPRAKQIYAADFVAPAGAPLPTRYAGVRIVRRTVWRYLLQLLIVRIR
jgi:hypothetical protein